MSYSQFSAVQYGICPCNAYHNAMGRRGHRRERGRFQPSKRPEPLCGSKIYLYFYTHSPPILPAYLRIAALCGKTSPSTWSMGSCPKGRSVATQMRRRGRFRNHARSYHSYDLQSPRENAVPLHAGAHRRMTLQYSRALTLVAANTSGIGADDTGGQRRKCT